MAATADVSVVIPSFNRAHCIREAVESALQQSVCCREIFVVDDGSTDDTTLVLAPYNRQIKVLHQPNSGVSAARNAGIQAATGKWIAFLDSDDEWEPEKIERQLSVHDPSDAIVAHGSNAWIHPPEGGPPVDFFSARGLCGQANESIVSSEVAFEYALNTTFVTPSLMMRRSELLAEGGFDTSLSMFEDLDLVARLALRGPFGIHHQPLCRIHRQGPAGQSLSEKSASQRGHAAKSLIYIYTKLLSNERLNSAQRQTIRQRLSAQRADLAAVDRADRGLVASFRGFRQSVADNPSVASASRALAGFVGGERGIAWARRLRHGKRNGFYR